MTKKIRQVQVSTELSNQRCDSAAAQLFKDYSRARLQTWIQSGNLTVNGKVVNQRHKVYEGDVLELEVVQEIETRAQACDIDLEVVYEDEDLLLLNKPAGLIVHPGAGHSTGTLMNGLLYHYPELACLARAGIVHRLDKDTSGLMVVAKSLEAHSSLVKQLQARTVSREYWALVQGVMTGGGVVNAPIARHPKQRVKMAVSLREGVGKEAITHYRVERRYEHHTLVRCFLETGRTHQIRVHMAHIRYPLLGDSVYAGRMKVPAGISPQLQHRLRDFPRQALHAKRLALIHPVSGEHLEWEIDLAQDIQELLALLA